MRLINVKIHNFRGILDEDINLQRYSLLVGANNSGKSSVIDAVRAFYEKDGFKFNKKKDFPFIGAGDNDSWVELQFLLDDDEHESLADEYKSNDKKLRVRKVFQSSENSKEGKIFAYTNVDGKLSSDPFYGARNVQTGKFGELVYIPAVSTVDEYAKLSGPSALRNLLTNIMGGVVKDGKAYGDFVDSVNEFGSTIRDEKTQDDRSLSGLEETLNDLLKTGDTKFALKISPPSAAEVIRQMIDWELVDNAHGKPQDIDHYGTGFQRHFIYSLIQISSRYSGTKPTRKTKDFTPSLNLVLFEEPEAFLHPPQQDILTRNLINLASSGQMQIICATHSSHFVSKNTDHIPAIVRLSRENGKVSKYQINEDSWKQIVNSNQEINKIAKKHPKMEKKLHSDDLKPEMEAVKHFLWLNSDRSSIFFANHVLLVEGQTEVAIINKLLGDGRIRDGDCGLYVLDCLGKYNIHRFMNLLSNLGIPHGVIYDDDDNKDEHEDINRLIESSRSQKFTLTTRPISGDFEKMIGIPISKADHRKPQHALYLYETGSIVEAKIKALCELVESCLPTQVSDANPTGDVESTSETEFPPQNGVYEIPSVDGDTPIRVFNLHT